MVLEERFARFVKEGARVIVADLNEDAGNELVSELGSAASFYKLDVRNNVEWKELAEYILELHGSFDILVNNAYIINYRSAINRAR